jgi:hypothetical protein
MCSTSRALTIDDFAAGEMELFAGPELGGEYVTDLVTAQHPLPISSVAGGLRQMKVGTFGYLNETEGTVGMRVAPVDGGVLSVGSDFPAENFWLRYGFTDYAGPALVSHDFDLNLDLLDSGLTALTLDFLSIDGPETWIPELDVTVYTNRLLADSEFSTVSVPLLKSPTPTSVVVDLQPLSQQLDLSDVDGIMIRMPQVAGDTSFSIGEVRLAPEPSSIALCGIAVFGLVTCGWASRRRRILPFS